MVRSLLRRLWKEARDDIIVLIFITIVFSIVLAFAYWGIEVQHLRYGG